MKIAYVVPGFGNTFYCQNCIQNLSLIKAMAEHNQHIVLAPMYIPFTVDLPQADHTPVFYGAINVYLKEYTKWFRHLPNWLHSLLNSKKLLQWISRKSGTTDPKGLEKMTLSVMQGAGGAQDDELHALLRWLKHDVRPDVVHLSNALLVGIGVQIKKQLGIPVFCTVQDENQWLDKMEEPYASQSWRLIQTSAEWIDRYISPSQYYAGYLQNRLQLSAAKFAVIPTGLDLQRYRVQSPSFDPPTLGYLSRISDDQSMEMLFRAFGALKKQAGLEKLQLKISGGVSAEDQRDYRRLKARTSKQPYSHDVQWVPDLYQQDINAFFESLTLLTVPSQKPEALGLFIFESLAAGIPVVQPAIGGYVEIIEKTGGGATYQPNTWQQLAETLGRVLCDPAALHEYSRRGLEAIRQCCSTQAMVSQLIRLYQSVLSGKTPFQPGEQQEDACVQ
ncbi:glycosyltransferase family 4 protein [candidate division FCPU426 bacterium]|nr:glycosyltransferase family 4 protein [candidate division FCPU426 bacterium]